MQISRIALVATLAASHPAYAQEADTLDLGTLTLEAESDATLLQNGYVAESGRQATRVDTPIRDIPQAISTVGQDQIEDQEPRTLLDALGYTSGANVTNFGFDSRYDAVYLRGFSAYYDGLFRDGLRQVNGPSAWFQNHPYTFEGVSVLKGPSSSMYGVSGAGGLVNIISKRPKDEEYNELKLTFGTDSRKELAFDFTGPVGTDGRLSYRLTGVARDADTPLPGYSDDLALLAPSFTYQLTDRTKITVLTEYSESTRGGTASYYNPSQGEASDIYVGDPDYNDFVNEQWRVGYELEHEMDNGVTLRQNLRYSEVDADLEFSGIYAAGTGFGRYWGHYLENSENFSVDTYAEGHFSTGAFDHTVVAGFDYTQSSYDAYYGGVGYVSAADTDAVDQPYSNGQEMYQYGVYVHDQLSSGPWTMFLSGRYDWVDMTTFDANQNGTDTSHNGFSGRVGLSYAFNTDLSVYANVSSSFVPTTGLVYDDSSDPNSGRAAEPTRGLQKEVGVKYQLPGTESLVTASLFDIRQEDGVVFQTVDPATFNGLNQVQVPYDLRSRGLEIEGQFNFANGMRVTSAYTYLDMEIEAGSTGTVGNQLSATPHHTASIWGFYEPQSGAFKGFGFGAGLRYVGESYGDDANTYKNDAEVFADLSMSYDFGEVGYDGLSAQINVKNVFDNTDQTCSADYCYRYEGRTATASVSYRF